MRFRRGRAANQGWISGGAPRIGCRIGYDLSAAAGWRTKHARAVVRLRVNRRRARKGNRPREPRCGARRCDERSAKVCRIGVGRGVPVAWLTLCAVWSSTWLAIKVGLRDLPPVSFVAIRFLIAIIVLLAVSIGRTRLLPLRRNDYVVLAITGVLMFAVNYTLLFWAELHVSSGLAAVLQATIPIFGLFFAHWMLPDEPLRLQKLAGAIIALGAVTVICSRLLGFNGPLAFWGGVGVIVGAASAAYANVLVKARAIQLAPAMLPAWQVIFGIAALSVLGC